MMSTDSPIFIVLGLFELEIDPHSFENSNGIIGFH